MLLQFSAKNAKNPENYCSPKGKSRKIASTSQNFGFPRKVFGFSEKVFPNLASPKGPLPDLEKLFGEPKNFLGNPHFSWFRQCFLD